MMPELGTMEDVDELLDQMRQRGMRLRMAVVVNHTADEHAWFVKSRTANDNAYEARVYDRR